MKWIYKSMIVFFIIIGYIFNMYYLTSDSHIRKYQWINKVGVIVVPLGSVMGIVYGLDKYTCLKNCKEK